MTEETEANEAALVEGSSNEPGTVEEAGHVCMCMFCTPTDRPVRQSDPAHICQRCFKDVCVEYAD